MMDERFVPAQSAIISDDAEEVERLVRADPTLATSRSTCDHPTLLCCLVLEMPPRRNLDQLIRLFVETGAELCVRGDALVVFTRAATSPGPRG
jgi:hypothetical protein